MQKFLISILRFYQKAISPYLKCSCRYYPTCSEYSVLAIKKEGWFKGVLKTFYRVIRCNPFSSGGIDFP